MAKWVLYRLGRMGGNGWWTLPEDRVLLEQLRMIYSGMTQTIIQVFPAIAFVAWVVMNPINKGNVIALTIFLLATNLYSLFNARRQLARGLELKHARSLACSLFFSISVGGISWGLFAFGTLGTSDQTGDVIVIALLSGLLGGAVGLMAPLLTAFIAFSIPVVGLTVFKLLLLGGTTYVALSAITVLYLCVLIARTRDGSRDALTAITLRFDNAELLTQTEIARKEAEQANAAKSTFLAAASHDLRQLIYAQGLFIDLMLQTRLTSRQRELMGHIRAVGEATSDMLNTLLDFSRIDAGVVQVRMQSIDIQSLLVKIEREFAPQAQAKGLRYHSSGKAIRIASDPMLLEQMLRNLVFNAIRYTEKGGVLVALRKRGHTVLLQVWDTGIGIGADHQAKIFDEFYQLGNPERDRKKGLGLGLAIVRGFANALGHALQLRSALGRGSVFQLCLPLARAEIMEDHPYADTVRPNATKVLQGVYVLLIDDDDAVLTSTSAILQSWGCTVAASRTMAEMREHAAKGMPGLIISDYRLREQATGAQLIAEIRTLVGVEVPAIIITGETSPSQLRDAHNSGIPLLHKPLTSSDLYAALVKIVPLTA